EVLGQLDETASGGAAAPAAQAPAAQTPAAPAAQAPAAQAPAAPAPAGDGADVKASPAARRLATEQGVDLAAVQGTGRGGVVSKPDVVEAGRGAAAQAAAAPAPAAASAAPAAPAAPRPADGTRETREKMTTRRRRIAENLLLSQQSTAHLTTFNEIDMTAVVALRERLKERVEKEHGVKLSFMPFFIKAAAMAL